MVDVRIDSQGVPKGPTYEWTVPALHRQVTAVDSTNPTAKAQGVDGSGYRRARFDIDTTASSGLTALTVQLLVWNETAGRYFAGAERQFSQGELAANPVPSLEVESRGAVLFLKVTAATATSLSLSIYAAFS